MMGDKVLGALDDPRKITDAELAPVAKRERNRQTRRIAEHPETLCEHARLLLRWSPGPERLGPRKVETEQIAAVIAHRFHSNERRYVGADLPSGVSQLWFRHGSTCSSGGRTLRCGPGLCEG